MRKTQGPAELRLQEINTKLTADDPNIIAWLHMSLMDPSFQAPVARGEVTVGPIRGTGLKSVYPHASNALSFLRMRYGGSDMSVHYVDRKRRRFIWVYKGRTVFVPLDRPLDPHYVLLQLRNIMEDVGVSQEDLKRVFSSRSSSASSKNGKQQVADEPQGSDEIFLSNFGSEIVDSRTVKAAAESGIKTLEDLRGYVQENGAEALVDLPGIGNKAAEKLTALLESEPA
jgi:hypothetical protein